MGIISSHSLPLSSHSTTKAAAPSSSYYGSSTYSAYSSSSSSSASSVKLTDCFRFFTTPETLQGDDAPYCARCKTHRASTKKMELYRFPEVLVVHLKRFAVGRFGGRGDKINTTVDFPLERLNLAEFAVAGALGASSDAEYDLFAVSNHMGSLGGGHYTAHARTQVRGNM